MHIILWDTRRNEAQKDFAGGMGVGMFPGGGGIRGRLVRSWYRRDYRPVAMNFAYMASIFQKLGHTVKYVEDHASGMNQHRADVYVFNPALLTLTIERQAMQKIRHRHPNAKILIVGQVAYAMPEMFEGLGTVVHGEPEQLLWKLDDVLDTTQPVVPVGSVEDLDTLPFPDWAPFNPKQFKIKYDFWKFPTAFIQQSRGCTFKCNYCPYIMVENKTRFRDPELVVAEMREGIERFGFRSFKFRDPLFGLDRKRVLRMAELIGQLPKKIQFSIESRIDIMKEETLRVLREVGLTSITVGIETPDEGTLKKYKRAPIKDDRQRDFVATCRRMGIRTVAGFMVGFPEDTEASILDVLQYARKVNPTYANFNIVTPYPGTEFFNEVRDQIANFDYGKYSVYEPVMKYENLTAAQVAELHARCFGKYYFRSRYLVENAHLLWPWLQRFGIGRGSSSGPQSPRRAEDSGLPILGQPQSRVA